MAQYDLIILLLITVCMVAIERALYYYRKNKINYHNYQSTLKALADYDKSLKQYLVSENLKNKKMK